MIKNYIFYFKSLPFLRRIIWFFVFALVFSGVFRKWIMPWASNPIMMIKDVLALLILLEGIRCHLINSVWAVVSMLLSVITFLFSMTFGHGDLLVSLWGCKIIATGIPVAVIIGRVLKREDVKVMLNFIMFIGVVSTIFVVFEYILPGGHWINAQAGGAKIKDNLLDKSAGEVAGLIRPSGIFSHTTQISLYCSLWLGCILFYLFDKRLYIQKSKPFLGINIVCFIITAICSVSRTVVFSSIGQLMFVMFFVGNTRTISKMVFVGAASLLLLLQTPFMQGAIDNMSNRIDNAANTTGGTSDDIFNRVVIYNIDAIFDAKTFSGEYAPFWGFGQGISTQMGGRYLGIGFASGFSMAEWDGKRIMLESGFLMGLFVLFNRILFPFSFFKCMFKERKKGNTLPLCIFWNFFVSFFLYTQWGNSFQLGFAIFSGGLFLASLKLIDSSCTARK